MSIWMRQEVKVRIQQLEGPRAPQPLPLESGFSKDREYEILGMHCPSESSEAYCILKNDRDEMWFISNRHLRLITDRPATKTHAYTNGKKAALYSKH